MAYTIYYDRIGSLQGDADNKAVNSYSRVWTVQFDAPVSDINYVNNLSELPSFYSVYSDDPYAILTKRSARQDEEDPSVWHITLTWSRVSADQRQATTNPIDRPPRVSWSTTQFEKPFDYDANGNMVCNSVGDRFNPPEMVEDSRVLAKVVYNLTYVPTWILDYRNKVNNAPLTIEGIFVDTNCARIMSVDVSEWKNEQNTYFREVVLALEMRDVFTVSKSSDGGTRGPSATIVPRCDVYGWQKAILDRGFQYINGSGDVVKILDKNNMEPSEPLLLDGKGGKLTVPTSPGDEVYRVFDAFEEVDFSVLNLPS